MGYREQYVRYTDHTDPRDRSRWHAEAYLLLVAIRHLLRACELANSLTGHHRIRDAFDVFDESADVVAARGVLEHLDAYVKGEGRPPTREDAPHGYGKLALSILRDSTDALHTLEFEIVNVESGEARGRALDLAEVYTKARDLAEVVGRVLQERGSRPWGEA